MDEHDPVSRPVAPTAVRATAIVAFVALLPILFGLLMLTRPVRTPLQDCGAAAAFLLEGRTELRFADADAPAGATEEQIRDHRDHPCQERAANRARPAVVSILVGLVVIVGAGSTEMAIRLRARGRDVRRIRRERADTGR